MDAHKRLQRLLPLNLVVKCLERLTLPLLQTRKRLHYLITQSCEERWRAFLHEFENVARELPVVCALFDDGETVEVVELFPHFEKLRGQQVSEHRPDTYVGEVIACSANRAAARGVISVLRMIERLLHKPGKRLRALCTNRVADRFNERRIQLQNVQRPALNVQSRNTEVRIAHASFDVCHSTLSVGVFLLSCCRARLAIETAEHHISSTAARIPV